MTVERRVFPFGARASTSCRRSTIPTRCCVIAADPKPPNAGRFLSEPEGVVRVDQIEGTFRIESDADGSFYRVKFTPDAPQTWSAQPAGIVFRFKNFRVGDMIGDNRAPELAAARTNGAVEFRGHLPRERYASYAGVGSST
jgi:hypothetical protein